MLGKGIGICVERDTELQVDSSSSSGPTHRHRAVGWPGLLLVGTSGEDVLKVVQRNTVCK